MHATATLWKVRSPPKLPWTPEHCSCDHNAERLLAPADLGLVDYVFCDKTGTLTSNEMQLRLLTIKGQSFGRSDFR